MTFSEKNDVNNEQNQSHKCKIAKLRVGEKMTELAKMKHEHTGKIEDVNTTNEGDLQKIASRAEKRDESARHRLKPKDDEKRKHKEETQKQVNGKLDWQNMLGDMKGHFPSPKAIFLLSLFHHHFLISGKCGCTCGHGHS